MPSKKKPAAAKRAPLPRASDYTKTFAKDWERLSRSGRYDLHRLKEAMLLLIANDGPLGPEWLDHPLRGNWDGHRECHIGGDFLLAYRLADDGPGGLIVFVRAGTHADLFDE
ncbi:type II toxin-antitoxin system YafQ family toxin [Pseudoroseomonas sp. WGS1072]|uniref:type II toxin-antitoxin system YafQ family toxin n=1 Tax=Roseomonas sp. WGS1072 TaxID=3366816 RepID=UPI003BF3DF06